MITRLNDEDLEKLAAEGRLVGYFGYGSLVNRATLRTAAVAAYPARLSSWRRVWRPPPDLGIPFERQRPAMLSVSRQPGAAIDGLLVIDLVENLAAVDRREAHYVRREIAPADLAFFGQSPGFSCPLHVYEARDDVPGVPGTPLIWRSYLDAVMQGLHAEFGPDGVTRFVDETGEFGYAVEEDRAAPFYPRAVTLGQDEIDLFEAALARRLAKTP